MNHPPLRPQRRLVDGLGHRRVGVDGGDEFFGGGFEAFGQADLGDQLGDALADHVGAEQFAVGFGGAVYGSVYSAFGFAVVSFAATAGLWIAAALVLTLLPRKGGA